MKATKLTIHNVGIIADTIIQIDKPLLLFYGECKAGKSTILNSIRWVMGGAFPEDIIRHGEREAYIQFEGADDGKPWIIRREWYTAKDGTTKARSITFTRNGVLARKPVDEIAKFLNPFLLDQDHLRGMTELQRGRYLAELFGVDTTKEDLAIAEASRQAAELRMKVKAYGDIDLTPAEPVDVAALNRCRAMLVQENDEQRAEARDALAKVIGEYEAQKAMVDARNREARIANSARAKAAAVVLSQTDVITGLNRQIKELQKRLDAAQATMTENTAYLASHPEQIEEGYPTAPDTSELDAKAAAIPDTAAIDAKIQQAGAANVRAAQYQANVKRQAAKDADDKLILALEAEQRRLKAAKVAKLADIAAGSKVPGLVFKEAGGFEFDNTDAGMLSDSQIMRLSQALSTLYPEGFGLSLIDRGESLGKSVMELNREAQDKESTILVTIVGEKPAKVPEHVGAFVVEKGVVKP